MASNKSKTPGSIQVVVVLMLSVLAFYFGNRFGQVFDFNTMEITDGALATVNSIVAAPAAISTASVPMLYAIGLAITVLIVWLYTFMYAGNYRYGEEAGSAKWGTLKEGVAFNNDGLSPAREGGLTSDQDFALANYKMFKVAAGKTLKSIIISCNVRMAPMRIEQVRELLKYDEMNLDEMGDPGQRTAVFAIMSDTDKRRSLELCLGTRCGNARPFQ